MAFADGWFLSFSLIKDCMDDIITSRTRNKLKDTPKVLAYMLFFFYLFLVVFSPGMCCCPFLFQFSSCAYFG